MRGGQTASAARQAAERVMEEREKLYVELKVCRRSKGWRGVVPYY